jgi:hypothetical protein
MNKEAENAQVALFEEVYLPAFIQKCASHGLTFSDQDSLQSALESVAMLKAAETTQKTSLAKSAAADLRTAMGLPQPEQVAAQQQQAAQQQKEASAKVENARVRKAIDSLIAGK